VFGLNRSTQSCSIVARLLPHIQRAGRLSSVHEVANGTPWMS
jgi:hypothetical protein